MVRMVLSIGVGFLPQLGTPSKLSGTMRFAFARHILRPYKLFGTVCTPENPMGSCLVSSEGDCAAYWSYGRLRQKAADIETVDAG
jgi:hydrogenase expression/formation protein HypD